MILMCLFTIIILFFSSPRRGGFQPFYHFIAVVVEASGYTVFVYNHAVCFMSPHQKPDLKLPKVQISRTVIMNQGHNELPLCLPLRLVSSSHTWRHGSGSYMQRSGTFKGSFCAACEECGAESLQVWWLTPGSVWILRENGLPRNNPIYGIINIRTLEFVVSEPYHISERQMLFHIWNYIFTVEVQMLACIHTHTHTQAHNVDIVQTIAIVSAFEKVSGKPAPPASSFF